MWGNDTVQEEKTQILIGSSWNAGYFFVKSCSWRYNDDNGKLMIILDEIKICDNCYWTVCFELPVSAGTMFSISTLTDICCNDSKVCIFPIRASFCHRYNTSNPLVICQGLSKQILTHTRKLWQLNDKLSKVTDQLYYLLP